MAPMKPVGEKPTDPNGRGGNTGAQVVSPAPNQDVLGPGGPPGDEGAKDDSAVETRSISLSKFPVLEIPGFSRNEIDDLVSHICTS